MPLPELHLQLAVLHAPCCEHHHAHTLPNLVADDLIDALIQRVFNGNGNYTQSPEMQLAIFNELWKGVMEGINKPEADYDTADRELIAALRSNVSQFSDAKDYTMLRELNAALLKPDGTLRSFDEFVLEARKITDIYLKQYLKVEYDLAVNGAQMAAKWKQIIANQATLPLLQFDAVIDTRTSETCRPLDGVTLPVNHPFWKRFYPPNHFNCRSTVRQLAAGAAVTTNIPAADVPELFQTNLGEATLIFPPNHPYYKR